MLYDDLIEMVVNLSSVVSEYEERITDLELEVKDIRNDIQYLEDN